MNRTFIILLSILTFLSNTFTASAFKLSLKNNRRNKKLVQSPNRKTKLAVIYNDNDYREKNDKSLAESELQKINQNLLYKFSTKLVSFSVLCIGCGGIGCGGCIQCSGNLLVPPASAFVSSSSSSSTPSSFSSSFSSSPSSSSIPIFSSSSLFSSLASSSLPNEYISSDNTVTFRYPSEMKNSPKLVKTHEMEAFFKSESMKGFNVGYTMDKVRKVKDIKEFASPQVLADKVISVERLKEGIISADLVYARESTANVAGSPAYEIEYKVDSTRGKNRYIVKTSIVNGRLYVVTVQCKEESVNSDIAATAQGILDSFQVLLAEK